MSAKYKFILALNIMGILSACSGGGGGSDPQTQAKGISNPTYYDNVASILNDHCVTCHRSGGIAPFTLDDYASASANALAIKYSTRDRIMPPFLADNSGSCNTFSEARWLNDADIATLANWADQGAPSGDSAPALEPPADPGLAQDEISATLSMDVPYTPQGSTAEPKDDYRCFVLNPGITENTHLTAYQVEPGNDALVHHIILFALNTPEAEAAAEALDAAEDGPGYTCFGDSGLDLTNAQHAPLIAGWAPGVKVTRFPVDTGVPLNADRKMIMQVHYNLENPPGPDQTQVKLALQKNVASPALMFLLADTNMVLQPGLDDAVDSMSITAPQRLRLHGVFPHMHTLGRSLTIERTSSDGQKQCLANLPRWDFEWQQFFFYENGPMTVNPGDTVKVTCHYDTRSRDTQVTWGNGTQDEMCVSFFYITS
jgi:hypothetical protein